MKENYNMKDSNKNELEQLIEKADVLYESKESIKEQEALKIYFEIIQKYPDNAYGFYSIGHCYEFGRGIIENCFKAKEYYEKATKLGSAGAASHLGTLYRLGELGEIDIESAKKYYSEGIKLGSRNSIKELAHIFKDEGNSECIKMYEKVLDDGDNDVLADLGNIYWRGVLTVKNISKAQEFFDKVCIHKDFIGMCKYADTLCDDMTIQHLEYYDKAESIYNAVITDAVEHYLAKPIISNAENGKLQLSLKYWSLNMYNDAIKMISGTETVEKNTVKAIEELKRLSDEGITDATIMLARLYFGDKYVERDFKKAAQYCLLAYNQGNYEGMELLALMYYEGHGVDVDIRRAREFAEIAKFVGVEINDKLFHEIIETDENQKKDFVDILEKAEDGDINAIGRVASAYAIGIGTEKNVEMALKYYSMGIEINDYKLILGYLYTWQSKFDFDNFLDIKGKELAVFKKLAEKIVTECCDENIVNSGKKILDYHESLINTIFMEAQLCIKPIKDIDLNKYFPARGIAILEILVDYGNMVAPYILAKYYREEKHGVLDYDMAIKYLKISTERGYYEAKRELGEMYYLGQGVEADMIQASRLLEEYITVARECGEQERPDYNMSIILLGMIYDVGLNETSKAAAYYREAAQKGITIAERNLGIIYATGGKEIVIDFEAAIYWLEKAIEGGDAEASEIIQKVYDAM